MTFKIDIGFVCVSGGKPDNEDFCAAMLPEPTQAARGAVVAIGDGVSTGGRGREAAQTTVMSIVRDYQGVPQTWDTTVALDRIIQAQNAWCCAQNRARTPLIGLTTLTALVLRGQTYTVAHVGDTRAYLLRSGRLSALTTDHVMPGPDTRHQLVRAIGAEDRLLVDYTQGDLQVGDVFVLLSDGVHGCVRAAQLNTHAAQDTDAQSIAQTIVDAALAARTQDNASALVVRVLGLDESVLSDTQRRAIQLPALGTLRIGQTLDGMTITQIVADNGASIIYQARVNDASRKLIAIKALHPSRQHDAQERAMLAHEAWLATALATTRAADHLVPTLGLSDDASGFYVRYQWLEGETLAQRIAALRSARQAPTTSDVLALCTQFVRAIGRLHQQGVIHRDIKPANLHLGADGIARILDLGVALSGHESQAARLLHAGTASYVNPEQWGYSTTATDAPPQAANAQSDLYAFGVTLYEWLTTRLPYGEVLPYQVGRFHRDPPPPSRHNPQVPIWLDHVVMKAISRDASARFETAEELLIALELGASRPAQSSQTRALSERDPMALWQMGLAVSVVLNALLVVWLMFLPVR